MKSFDLTNAPDTLVEMANNQRLQISSRNVNPARKQSNIAEVDSDNEDRESNHNGVLSNIEEEKIYSTF